MIKRLNKNAGNKPTGFTLLETVIYLSIVGIMLVSISYLLSDLILGQVEQEVDLEINYSSVFIIQQLKSDIHSAKDITSIEDKTLSLIIDEDQVIYHFDSENKKLVRQSVGSPVEVLHHYNVLADGYFENLSFMDRSANVRINLFLSYNNPGNRREFNARSTTTATFELRGRR